MNYVNEQDFCDNKKQYYPMMLKIINKKLRYVCNKDEIESIIDEVLFDSMRLFKNKGYQFSTYLSKACGNKSGQILSKKIRINQNEKRMTTSPECISDYEYVELRDILEELKKKNPELYDVLTDSYLNGMNNVEIGKKNGYCSENARKKILKALKLCQKMVYD